MDKGRETYAYRLVHIVCVIALLVSWPVGPALAAHLTEGPAPSLPEQAASVKIQTVSTARNNTCAIKTNGTLACWGENQYGEGSPRAGTFTQVSMGYYHACGLKTDGTVVCWGTTVNGQDIGFPTGMTFTQIGAGEVHTCGLKTDGTIYCWGGFDANVTTAPSGTFTQVAVGRGHNCAIRTNGTLDCWGAGETNTGTDPEYGQAIPPSGTFKDVSAGWQTSCGIRTNGVVECWGNDLTGQVGETPSSGTFIQVNAAESHVCAIGTDGAILCWGNTSWDKGSDQTPPNGMTFTQVSGGSAHTCGLRTDGVLLCWGAGQTNTGSWPHYGQSIVPAGVSFGRSQLSAGFGHTCWLKNNGSLACWGGIAAPPAGAFMQVSSGDDHACAIKTDGTLDCWGDNSAGQLNSIPGGTFTQVSAGLAHTCAVQTNSGLACWGSNVQLQLTGTPTGTFTHVSAGGFHSCGLRTNGTVDCWGNNAQGQATDPSPTTFFTQVSAGYQYTCGLLTDGTLNCWGDDSENQIADMPTGTFTQLSAGGLHACAIKTDGTLTCWGRDVEGQATPPAGTFKQVSAGNYHTCGLKTGGKLVCWGENSSGESLPVTISGNAGAPGMTLSYTDDITKTATANGSGSYSFQVTYDWSGTVTPSSAGYRFIPVDRSYANLTSNQPSQDYVADNTPPSVSASARASGNPTAAASVDFAVTFSESVTGVDTTDFVLSTTGVISGALISGMSGSGAVYTVTVDTGSGEGTLHLDVIDDDSIQDAVAFYLGGDGAGNGDFTGGETYTVDRTSPAVVSSLRVDPSPTNADSVNFVVTFTEPVTGVDATDFDLFTTDWIFGAFVDSISGSGATYTVTVDTGYDDGTLRLDVIDEDGILDLAGNPLGGAGAGNGDFTSGEVYTLDQTPPCLCTIDRADANPTNAANVNFLMTFSEVVTGVDVTDFSLDTTGLTGASVIGVSGSGNTRTITVNTGTGSGSIRLDVIDDDSIVDWVSNPLGGEGAGNGDFTFGETYDIDKTPPVVVSSLRFDPNPTSAASVTFAVTFAEPVTGVDVNDFNLSTTGTINGAVVSSVDGLDANYVVTVNTGSGYGTIRLNVLDNDSVVDAVSNPLGGSGAGNGAFTAGEAYTLNRYYLRLPLVARP